MSSRHISSSDYHNEGVVTGRFFTDIDTSVSFSSAVVMLFVQQQVVEPAVEEAEEKVEEKEEKPVEKEEKPKKGAKKGGKAKANDEAVSIDVQVTGNMFYCLGQHTEHEIVRSRV